MGKTSMVKMSVIYHRLLRQRCQRYERSKKNPIRLTPPSMGIEIRVEDSLPTALQKWMLFLLPCFGCRQTFALIAFTRQYRNNKQLFGSSISGFLSSSSLLFAVSLSLPPPPPPPPTPPKKGPNEKKTATAFAARRSSSSSFFFFMIQSLRPQCSFTCSSSYVYCTL